MIVALKIGRSAVRPRPWPPSKSAPDLQKRSEGPILFCSAETGQERHVTAVRGKYVAKSWTAYQPGPSR